MHRNPLPPVSASTAVGEWSLKINITFNEYANTRGTEIPIRYATSGFEGDLGLYAWEELDPLEPDMASAWSASNTDF
jgi:hypothetical protein